MNTYQITQEGKHHYLVDLSRNLPRGMIRFAKKGSLLGMPTPYGYDRLHFDAARKEMCRVRRREKFHNRSVPHYTNSSPTGSISSVRMQWH